MRFPFAVAVLAGLLAGTAFAKLPPLSDDAKAKAAATAAKAAWSGKVGLYEVCMAMDRSAAVYRADAKASGKAVDPPIAVPPCVDPGPYVAAAAEPGKPLEASGAHSPPGMATSPPGSNATSAEITGPRK